MDSEFMDQNENLPVADLVAWLAPSLRRLQRNLDEIAEDKSSLRCAFRPWADAICTFRKLRLLCRRTASWMRDLKFLVDRCNKKGWNGTNVIILMGFSWLIMALGGGRNWVKPVDIARQKDKEEDFL